MSYSEENFKRFQKHLRQSTPDVFRVAHHLHRQGFAVYLPPYKEAQDLSEIAANQDQGDLFMKHGDKWLTVEVKANNKSDFSDVKPHIWSHFLVCAVHAFDKYKGQKPSYYFIVNKSRTHVAVINVKQTFQDWIVKETGDHRYIGYRQRRYACPSELVTIQKLIYE